MVFLIKTKLPEIGKSILYNRIYPLSIILFLTTSCHDPKKETSIEKAVEIICPGAPKTLAIGVSKEELRKALRKQYSHDNTRDTALKIPNGSNILIPTIRPRDLDKCIIRSIPKIIIPSSMGY